MDTAPSPRPDTATSGAAAPATVTVVVPTYNEALLKRHGTDYSSVAERYADDDSMRAWFGAGWRGTTRFEYKQLLDYDGLRGRLMSSSYVPKPGHAQHAPMIAALRELFERCQQDGRISFDYDTRIIVGSL